MLLDVLAKDAEPGVGVEVHRRDGGLPPAHDSRSTTWKHERPGSGWSVTKTKTRPGHCRRATVNRECGPRCDSMSRYWPTCGPIADLDDARRLGRVSGRGREGRLEVRDQVLPALARRRLGVDDRGEREAGPAEDRLHQGDRDAPLDLEEVHGSARAGRERRAVA